MTPEERAKELLTAIVERGTGGWRFAEELEDCVPLIATAIREATEEYRIKAECYDACESVARNRLAHIKPEVEGELPALCGVDQKTWLQHKVHMPINAIDMLNHAERKVAIREACNEKLEEAALALVPGRDAMRASFAENFTTEEDAPFAKLGGLIVELAEACMTDIRSLKDPTP